jgi:hypothetical protein
MKTLLNQPRFHYSPDDGGGSGSSTTFKVGDEELTEQQLLNGYQGSAANTRRAQELANFRRELEQREAEMRDREARLLDRALDAPDRGRGEPAAAAAPATPEFDSAGWRNKFDSIDLMGDEDAAKKVAELIEEREAAMTKHYESVADMRVTSRLQEVDERLKEHDLNTDRKLSSRDRSEKAEDRNNRVLDEVLSSKYGNLTLSKEERAEVDKMMRQHLGQDYGGYDQSAGTWLWNERAVDDAVWSTPSVRERILSQREADARNEGLMARINGESASDSTPGRLRRPVQPNKKEEALIAKATQLEQNLRNLPPEKQMEYVQAHLTPAEMAEYRRLRHNHLSGG